MQTVWRHADGRAADIASAAGQAVPRNEPLFENHEVRRGVDSLFRRLGVRTHREIEEERTALKLLRGDFRCVAADGNLPAKTILAAVRA